MAGQSSRPPISASALRAHSFETSPRGFGPLATLPRACKILRRPLWAVVSVCRKGRGFKKCSGSELAGALTWLAPPDCARHAGCVTNPMVDSLTASDTRRCWLPALARRRVYWAPHSKRSRFSVRMEKRCPLGQVIVTCASPGFSLSGACAVIAPHSGHLAPQYRSPTTTCNCSVAIWNLLALCRCGRDSKPAAEPF
jgi:hypothetical protein